ncbi:MAG: ribonuclease HI [Deltaproteobacteria bacterium]|nr:ribonuclease HI [Deltaproteobacteria bacterium]
MNQGMVNIYTDGCCLGNPGPGGYGTVLSYNGHKKELSGGFRLTTNNRMEIMAAIAGLKELKTKCTVIIHSDSKLLVDAMSKGWIEKWKEDDWENRLNADLWDELLTVCAEHEVLFRWVKGHNGHSQNEYCDKLAKKVSRQKRGLLIDTSYENEVNKQRGEDLWSR